MKIAIIMRGIPGSGKSTFVDFLNKSISAIQVHAVDDLHVDDEDHFLWDESKAESRYLLNYANFVKSCSQEFPVVVCDCINIDKKSVNQYVHAAKSFGYFVYVVTPDVPSVLEASTRNKHQVSAAQIKDMVSRWEEWPDKSNF